MPEAGAPPKEEINLLTALRTAFSTDGDPHLFIARASDQIAELERAMIDTCSKNRIRVDENLYALLESRDAIAEQTQELAKATDSGSEITKNVNIAVASLSERMRVRQNLDAALAVAAQTRKLTRMYARIEDTIDSRRLYTAFRMLQVLEEETRCVQPGTILKELVPDSGRLRSQIKHHAKKSFQAWLTAVRQFEFDLGSYALHHAAAQALSDQKGQESTQVVSASDSKLLLQALTISGSGESSAAHTRHMLGRPWTPMLTPHIPPTSGVSSRNRPPRTMSAPRGTLLSSAKASMQVETNVRPNIGDDSGRGLRSFSSEWSGDVPVLYLRPLLQSVLVTDGLEFMGELRSDYRRERQAHLLRTVDEARTSGEKPLSLEDDSPRVGSSRAKQIEEIVCRVVGFFVVERAVENHASCTVLTRSMVDGDLWALAYPRVQSLLQDHEESSLMGAADKARLRNIGGNVERFAQVNGLPC